MVEAFFNHINQRNTGEVINEDCCGDSTNYFVKRHEVHRFMGPGTIWGRCGEKKDKNRVFCCGTCFNKGYNYEFF